MPSTTPRTGSSQRGVVGLESPELLEFIRHELSRRKHVVMRMSGSSMRPTIDDGDLLTLAPVSPQSLRPRDVVLFSTESGTALVHRLVRLSRRDGCAIAIARGDNSQSLDPVVPLTRLIARVIAIQKRGSKRMVPVRRHEHIFQRLAEFFSSLLHRWTRS